MTSRRSVNDPGTDPRGQRAGRNLPAYRYFVLTIDSTLRPIHSQPGLSIAGSVDPSVGPAYRYPGRRIDIQTGLWISRPAYREPAQPIHRSTGPIDIQAVASIRRPDLSIAGATWPWVGSTYR